MLKGVENTQLCNESLVCMLLEPIFLINLVTSIFLCGLIWVIQLLHYPSFHFVDETRFTTFHAFHNRRISIIVIPMMITELVTSGILWWNSTWWDLNAIGFYLVTGIWIATFLLSVPIHGRLSGGKQNSEINLLINTNWIRTVLWSLKVTLSVLVLINN